MSIKDYIKGNKIINNRLFDYIEKNIDVVLNTINVKELSLIIEYAKNKYYNSSEPVLLDNTYDKLLDRLEELDPNNKSLKSIGYTIDSINKIKLPYHMGSMTKIKAETSNLLDKWKDKFKGPYLVSDKLDGISAMLEIDSSNKMNLYTRGDGTVGSNITHLVSHINIKNVNNIIKYIKNSNLNRIILRGELIIKVETFENKYKNTASNPRNFVGGQINAKKINFDILKDIDLVFYEVIEPWKNIDEQYNILTELQLYYSPFDICTFNNLSINFLSNELKKRKENSLYEIDGIIVSDINKNERNIEGNPSYSFAFKEISEIVEATVEKVEWNISKHGYLKPRIKIVPIKIGNVQITYATAYNAKYIYDNKIGVNTIVQIIRSGDVIPKIIKVIKPSKEAQMPSGKKWKWNKTNVDIILIDKEIQGDQLIRILSSFVKSLNIKNIDEATFKVFVDNNLINRLSDIFYFYLDKNDLLKLDGFQERKTAKIIEELNDGFKNMHLTDLMIASNIFGHGLGDKKIKKIMEEYPDIILQRYKPKDELIKMIDDIEGFDDVLARQFIEHLDEFAEFLEEIPEKIKNRLMLDTIKRKDKKKVSNLKLLDVKIVFTGFRNKEWQKQIEELGGSIVDSVSSNTSLLVCESLDDSSNKLVKARKHNVPIISKSEFKDYMKNKYNVDIN
jgi:NAD-dependent DNA ligase